MQQHVHWQEAGRTRSAYWPTRHPRPAGIVVAGDELRAGHALNLARKNRAVLWRGDFRNARQLLAAMKRRLNRQPTEPDFHQYRRATTYRARILNRVVLELGPGYVLDAPHAPDVSQACLEAFGPADERLVMPLPEILGAVGAHQWRIRGVDVPAIRGRIHPHYGVFGPTRQEYVDLVAAAPWPRVTTAFDIGTGTGVLAALLARRGAAQVVATDIEARAVACAQENIDRLGLADRVRVQQRDLFPPGRADLVVCNPPWLPGKPASALDAAVYDPGFTMLRRFVAGLPAHMTREAWLVISDLAEHLGLRTRDDLLRMFADAGLVVADRMDVRPRNRRRDDPLAEYRAKEVTSLWRLRGA